MSDETTSVEDSIASATSAYEFPTRPVTSFSSTRPMFASSPRRAARIPCLIVDIADSPPVTETNALARPLPEQLCHYAPIAGRGRVLDEQGAGIAGY